MAAPVLAVGDGALGFWKAVRDVFPETTEQRCWWHKIGNILAALPKSAHPAARTAMAEIYNAEDKTHARAAAKAFAAEFGTKWPKAAAKISDDLDVLLAFYDYPAEHWIHLRTTNPIESTFATVRLETTGHQRPRLPRRRRRHGVQADRVSPNPLADASTHPHLVALVRAGATFVNGKLVERPDDQDQQGGDQASGVRRADPQVLTISPELECDSRPTEVRVTTNIAGRERLSVPYSVLKLLEIACPLVKAARTGGLYDRRHRLRWFEPNTCHRREIAR